MNDAQRMVTAFHRAFDVVIGPSPALPDAATCALRVNLIQEEFDELREALTRGDMELVAKELADLLYVVYGTAVSCGIDMEPVFQEVHRSNMTKIGGHKRADGKWIKPPDYSPACLGAVLAAQGLRPSTPGMVHPDAPVRPAEGAVAEVAPPSSGAVARPVSVAVAHPESAAAPPAARGAPEDPGGEPVSRVPPSRSDTRRVPRTRPCPRCGRNFLRRSHRHGVREHLLSLIYIYPFRCQVCGHRFKIFQCGTRYAKRLIDRRQYERLPTHLPAILVESVKPGELRVAQGTVTDISLAGCYVHTTARLSAGTLLALKLQTGESDQPLSVDAAIVRSVRPAGVGLEFLRLHESQHRRLSQFVRQLLTARDAAAQKVEPPG